MKFFDGGGGGGGRNRFRMRGGGQDRPQGRAPGFGRGFTDGGAFPGRGPRQGGMAKPGDDMPDRGPRPGQRPGMGMGRDRFNRQPMIPDHAPAHGARRMFPGQQPMSYGQPMLNRQGMDIQHLQSLLQPSEYQPFLQFLQQRRGMI